MEIALLETALVIQPTGRTKRRGAQVNPIKLTIKKRTVKEPDMGELRLGKNAFLEGRILKNDIRKVGLRQIVSVPSFPGKRDLLAPTLLSIFRFHG